MIEVRNFNFWYPGREIATLNDINLNVQEGEFVLLTGPTGCGKSTLLKTLNGIIPHLSGGHFQGAVFLDEQDIAAMTMAKLSAQIGLVQQNPDDQIFATVIQDEVVFGPENLCLPRAEIEERLEWALQAVELTGYRKRSTAALSGGQKQRLAIAAMLALKPRVLALDEPISQLDPQGAAEVMTVIKKLNKEYGVTVVMVEHRIHEVAQFVDRIVVMDKGRLVFDASVRQAMAQADMFAGMGLRLPETVEISQRFKQKKMGLTVGETVNLLRQGKKTQEKIFVPTADYRAVGQIPVLEVKELFYRYSKKGELALNGISVCVAKGEKVAVMGRNGAGKSTLLAHMAGLNVPQQGTVEVMGCKITKRQRLPLGMVGMVTQNPDLMLFQISVRRELEFGLHNMKLSVKEIEHRYMQAIKEFSLNDLQEDPPLALSRGQRLRTAIAAIVAMGPKLVFLDEPTTGQDKRNMDIMMAALMSQVDTLVFGTHDVEIAIRYASRVIVMDQGKIVADGTPRAIFANSDLLASVGLRPTQSWLVGQALGIKDVFTPQELEKKWVC